MMKSIGSFGLVLVAVLFSGCGPSKDDLIAKAMKRKRSSVEDDSDRQAGIQKPLPDKSLTQSPNPSTQKRSERTEQADLKTGGEDKSLPTDESRPRDSVTSLPEKELVAIEDQKSSAPLTNLERQKRAIENLKAVQQALIRYAEDTGSFPYYAVESSGGISTLSWRVEILPYLGYKRLYDRFDRERPWDSPQNVELLKYIPREYVSPERFDTKTNIVLPIANDLVFRDFEERDEESDEPKRTPLSGVIDGLANTILLVEVDDPYAVPWTKPADYRLFGAEGGRDAIARGFGKLRPQGGFAIWGNGWPLALDPNLPFKPLYQAFTYRGNERQKASVIHREIVFADNVAPSDRPLSSVAPESNVAAVEEVTQAEPLERHPIPNALERSIAKERFESLYGDRIRAAKDPAMRTSLASELLSISATMHSDPAGAYVMQNAAMELGRIAGSIETVLAAVDARIMSFMVDSYDENLTALLDFSKANSQTDPTAINGIVFLQRAISVIHAAIQNDDYDHARIVARSAGRLIDLSRNKTLTNSLGRLGTLLGEAERQYEQAKVQLAAYRDDPEDGEAAAIFGRYLCFIKGDWERGIPLLVQGGPDSLRRVARIDLQGSKSKDSKSQAEIIAIADSWWDLAGQARPGVYRQGAMDRAAHWYRDGFEEMAPSLDKIHVKARLEEYDGSTVSSPLALTAQLADASGVDLAVSLSEPLSRATAGRLVTSQGSDGVDVNN